MCAEIFKYCNNITQLLQKADISPIRSLSAITLLKMNLQSILDKLPELVQAAAVQADKLQLPPPIEKRQTKTPSSVHYDSVSKTDNLSVALVASICSALDVMLHEILLLYGRKFSHIAQRCVQAFKFFILNS